MKKLLIILLVLSLCAGSYFLFARKADYDVFSENGYTYRREDVYRMNLEDYQHDSLRVSYIRDHLRECSRAIRAGVNLKGYFYWSVMDCWELSMGFGYPMGLIGVNLDTLERIPRDSFRFYQQVIENNAVI